jgi:hypothetical protein
MTSEGQFWLGTRLGFAADLGKARATTVITYRVPFREGKVGDANSVERTYRSLVSPTPPGCWRGVGARSRKVA